jgi:hypothetical protein
LFLNCEADVLKKLFLLRGLELNAAIVTFEQRTPNLGGHAWQQSACQTPPFRD